MHRIPVGLARTKVAGVTWRYATRDDDAPRHSHVIADEADLQRGAGLPVVVRVATCVTCDSILIRDLTP